MLFDNLTTFAGKPVTDWVPGTALQPGGVCYRLRCRADEGDDLPALIEDFVAQPGASEVDALTIGLWDSYPDSPADDVAEALLRHCAKLPALRSLMFGDISQEECEVSWIMNTDLGPLVNAFELERFWCRGGGGLRLQGFAAPALRELVVQAGGLAREAVRDVLGASAELPNLEHLELWLGTDEYHGSAAHWADFHGLFYDDDVFPNLRYLGLKNAMNIVELVGYICGPPPVALDDLAGVTIAVLGDFEDRDGVAQACEKAGATVQPSFSLQADLVFAGRDAPQLAQAFYFGVPVLFATDVDELLAGGKTHREPAPILKRVRQLDLSYGVLGDEGLDMLSRHPLISTLERLLVEEHYGAEGWSDVFEELGVPCELSTQWPSGPNDRYVAVSE